MNAHAAVDTSLDHPEQADVVESAREAGLNYGTDDDVGYRRKPWGRGVTYICEDGTHLKDEEERERIESLAIPPDWTDVWIAADRDRHILATGRDSAGRKQYIYHPEWEEVRQAVKFAHLLDFGRRLPVVRRRSDDDMRTRKLYRDRVLGLVITLLDRTLFRVGYEEYVRRHGHHGLTTLRKEHVDVKTTSVAFQFIGKSEVEQSARIVDRRIARQVSRLFELPGERLFNYENGAGKPVAVTPDEVNDYLREAAGLDCSTKDFRTWGATRTFVEHLLDLGPPTGDDERETFLREAIRRTAEELNNTERVCRRHYLHPDVVAAYENASFWPVWQKIGDDVEDYFTPVERLVLELG